MRPRLSRMHRAAARQTCLAAAFAFQGPGMHLDCSSRACQTSPTLRNAPISRFITVFLKFTPTQAEYADGLVMPDRGHTQVNLMGVHENCQGTRMRPNTQATNERPGAGRVFGRVAIVACLKLTLLFWSIADVLRVMVAEINGLDNTPGAERSVATTPPHPTAHPEMAQLAEVLRGEHAVVLQAVETTKVVSTPVSVERVDGSDVVLAASNRLTFQPAQQARALVQTRPEPGFTMACSTSAFKRSGRKEPPWPLNIMATGASFPQMTIDPGRRSRGFRRCSTSRCPSRGSRDRS